MLKKISISNKCCSFELSVQMKIKCTVPTKTLGSTAVFKHL